MSFDFYRLVLEKGMEGKSPRERAAWLTSQPMLSDALKELLLTPDHLLVATIRRKREEFPAFAGALGWLLERGEGWLIETAREARRLRGQS